MQPARRAAQEPPSQPAAAAMALRPRVLEVRLLRAQAFRLVVPVGPAPTGSRHRRPDAEQTLAGRSTPASHADAARRQVHEDKLQALAGLRSPQEETNDHRIPSLRRNKNGKQAQFRVWTNGRQELP